MSAAGIIEHFSALPDPRVRARKNEHKLIDIIVITVCAVICGANDWTEIAQYGVAKKDWFAAFLELPNGFSRLTHSTCCFPLSIMMNVNDASLDGFGRRF